MDLVWVTTWCLIATLAEIVAGNHGVVVPFLAAVGFYFTTIYGWRRTICAVLLFATLVDVALMRSFPAAGFAVLATLPLATFWRIHGDCRWPVWQVGPGAAVGVVYAVVVVLAKSIVTGRWVEGEWLMDALVVGEALAAAAIVLPLCCRVLDWAAAGVELPLYADAQQRPGERDDR